MAEDRSTNQKGAPVAAESEVDQDDRERTQPGAGEPQVADRDPSERADGEGYEGAEGEGSEGADGERAEEADGERSEEAHGEGSEGADGERSEVADGDRSTEADGEMSEGDDGEGSEEEIDLTEGKTLSDYLEDEPPAPRTDAEPDYRSVSNVEAMVVPPPGGVPKSRAPGTEAEDAAAAPASRDARPRGGDPSRGSAREGSGAAQPQPRAAEGGASSSQPRIAAGAPSPRPAGAGEPGAERGAHGGGSSDATASPEGAPRAAAASGAQDRSVAPSMDEGSFGEMFEKSLKARTFEEGQTVHGVIVAIGPDVAFLDIGAKSEATIDIAELKDAEGDIEVEMGDHIDALVVSTEGGLKLSRKLARGAAAKEMLGDAFRAGLPVEGRVEKSIKGGYEVRVAGQRAFCPISQIDVARTADPSGHEGKVYTFRIIEYKEGGKNLVLSRRSLLAEEEKAKAEETRKTIVAEAVLKGRVASVREYGVFVDLGGVQGLLHVSEMGWARVSNPADVLKPGDEVTVKVLKVDAEKGRISLGLKQLQPDPWSKVPETYHVGQTVPGRIMRVQDFGAFVEVEPGIEALAHASTFAPTGTPDGWKKAIRTGERRVFEILTVDPERKRIGVAMLEEGASRAAVPARAEREASRAGAAVSGTDVPPAREEMTAPLASGAAGGAGASGRSAIAAGMRLKGKVERHESYGVFVYLAPGRTGLMPAGETGTQRGTDLRKAFPVGSEIEVLVLETEPSGRRIRLSRKALLDNEEKDDAREFAERKQGQARSQESFGSIGDKLRAALAARQK